MRKFFTLIVILLLHVSSFSQELNEYKPGKLKDKFALLFSVNGFNLKSFNGGIGWKKWQTNEITLVSKLNILFSKEEKEKTNELNGVVNEEQKYEFSLGVMKHISFVKRFSPYIGGQLGISYEKMEHKIIYYKEPYRFDFYPYYKNETKQKSTSLSLQMAFGFEYFLTKRISFAGQYNFGGYYRFGTEKIASNILAAEQDVSEIYFGIWSSSIILSVYF